MTSIVGPAHFARLVIAVAAVVSADVAFACSPLPPGHAERLARQTAATVDKKKSSLVEAVVVRAAQWPQWGTLRVTRSYWGKVRVGARLSVQPQPGSMCGPGGIKAGQRGLMQLRTDQESQPPMPFYGFMSPHVVQAYRESGLLPR